MLKVQGLRTTIYNVPDLQAAKAWYTKAFGVAPYFDQPFYIGYNIVGYELGLMPDDTIPADTKTTNVLSYWGVPNVHEALEAMLKHGATEDHPPMNVGDDIWTVEIKDPWGNLIGLIDNPTFKLPA